MRLRDFTGSYDEAQIRGGVSLDGIGSVSVVEAEPGGYHYRPRTRELQRSS